SRAGEAPTQRSPRPGESPGRHGRHGHRYRRSSTGTSPASSTSPAGGHGPNQLSGAPSSVTTEPLKALPNGDASSVTSHACSLTFPRRCTGTERDIPARTAAGYLTITSVSNVPGATVATATPVEA